MEDRHRIILRHHWSNIRMDLEPDNILAKLVEILNDTDEGEIKAQATREKRCDKLLEILPRKGPNAFKVFVEALKEEASHLASDLIEAEKGTENELSYARKQSAKRRGEIRELNAELEAVKQDHIKTSQELKELRTENQELAKIIHQLTEKSEEGKLKLEKESENRQRDLEEVKKDLACEIERAKDYQQKFQAESRARDDMPNKNFKNGEKLMRKEYESLQEKLREERSKSDNLGKEVHRLKLTWKEMPGQIFSYSKDFDKRGIVYALTTNSGKTSQVNPSSAQIVVTRSSDGEGHAEDVLKNHVRSGTVSGTKDKEYSWWRVDLTEKYVLYLTHYTLRHGRDSSMSVLLNWLLEGSLDGRKWITLKTHEDDHGLNEHRPYCTCTWAIHGKSNAFRFFRIFQTRKNSSGRFDIFLSGIELYGVLIEKSN